MKNIIYLAVLASLTLSSTAALAHHEKLNPFEMTVAVHAQNLLNYASELLTMADELRYQTHNDESSTSADKIQDEARQLTSVAEELSDLIRDFDATGLMVSGVTPEITSIVTDLKAIPRSGMTERQRIEYRNLVLTIGNAQAELDNIASSTGY